ncbi:MAG: transcriptional repressor [Flavobacteriales bacterium]|nr:transcriptional repressor [Flavobacteriales bacterium]|tara:strand:+ start:124 stop:549 length:426 start_codon:yes stop_codon:yes gene_type:complete
MSLAKEILKSNGLKLTENRRVILNQFISTEYALSYSDINSMIKRKLDKVTVYRTLKSFEESGIIHEVVDGGSQVKYALCNSNSCSSEHHNDTHIHFKCNDCEKTYCIDDIMIPRIKLPSQFQQESQSVFIQGKCEKCKTAI